MKILVLLLSLTSFSSNLIASLSYTLHQSILDTKKYPVSSPLLLFNCWNKQSTILLSDWLVLNILVISTWLAFWLVNCIRFSWIICGFFILTKFFAYTFFLKNVSPSLVFVLQKHPNLDNFHRENSIFPRICLFNILSFQNQYLWIYQKKICAWIYSSKQPKLLKIIFSSKVSNIPGYNIIYSEHFQ